MRQKKIDRRNPIPVEYFARHAGFVHPTLFISRKALCEKYVAMMKEGFLTEGNWIEIQVKSPRGNVIKIYDIENFDAWNQFVNESKTQFKDAEVT